MSFRSPSRLTIVIVPAFLSMSFSALKSPRILLTVSLAMPAIQARFSLEISKLSLSEWLLCSLMRTSAILFLTLRDPDVLNLQKTFTYLLIFFAQILWPIWVPLSILMLEENENRIKYQKIFVAAGIMVSIYLAFCILSYGIEAKIVENHITYIQKYPSVFRGYGILFYALATIAPAFSSSVRRIRIFGTAILISYVISAIFYEHYVLSVWCFFSAIISFSIYFILKEITRSEQDKIIIHQKKYF